MFHMRLIDGHADDVRPLERRGEFRSAPLKPRDHFSDGGYASGQLHRFLSATGLLADPGKIE